MRYFNYILLFVLLLACVKKNRPSAENMRRFTFATYNALGDSIAFKSINSDNKLQHTLSKSGVVNYNYCTQDTISFLVLDMNESFNLEKTKLLFHSLSEDDSKLKVFTKIFDGEYQLLDRIYKMEQKKENLPEEGQLIPLRKVDYARHILTLEIINDSALAKEYVAVHGIGMAWPEITQNMKAVGIHEMELYLMGYRAFLIMDTKPDFDWDIDGKKWSGLPREKEWQAYVARFQKTNPESKAAEKWKSMQRISMLP